MRNRIISLQEVNAGRWVAKYQGNYGVYTIRMHIDERGNGSDYSCSCPSDYYPCKHIGFIEQAIAEHRINRTHESSGSAPTPEELLRIAKGCGFRAKLKTLPLAKLTESYPLPAIAADKSGAQIVHSMSEAQPVLFSENHLKTAHTPSF